MEIESNKLTFVDFTKLTEPQLQGVRRALLRLTGFNWSETTMEDWVRARKVGLCEEPDGYKVWGLVKDKHRLLITMKNNLLIEHVGFAWFPKT